MEVDEQPTDYLEVILDTVQKRDFDMDITCSLCNNVLRDAHTLIECGDSFCKNCVCLYFSYKKNTSCPKCQVSLGGRPLELCIPDPTIQKFTDMLYPEF